jgi:hypothetical protein
MHAQNQSRPARSENQSAIESPTPIIGMPLTESVELMPTLRPSQPLSLFHNVILPESGVPFSPLND